MTTPDRQKLADYICEEIGTEGIPELNKESWSIIVDALRAPEATNLEDRPIEIWKGERKVTIYDDIVLRVWGPNMENEMSEEKRTHESVGAAIDWLYASPEAYELAFICPKCGVRGTTDGKASTIRGDAPEAAKTSVQLSELDDASNACLELASKHGFATGHGDTVADMIREFSSQIRAPEAGEAKPVAWRWPKSGIDNGFYYFDDLDGMDERHKQGMRPLYAAPVAGADADLATLSRVIDDTFEALGVTDNEAALVEIERLKAGADTGLGVSREAIARHIRFAMLDNPTCGSFHDREQARSIIADRAADAILALAATPQS